MHKNPTNARFIITAPACSMKPSSKYITFAFKLNFHNVNPYSKKSSYYLGFWTISVNQPVMHALNLPNGRENSTFNSSFYLSTLYAKIPHKKLSKVFNKLINFCLKGGNDKFMC